MTVPELFDIEKLVFSVGRCDEGSCLFNNKFWMVVRAWYPLLLSRNWDKVRSTILTCFPGAILYKMWNRLGSWMDAMDTSVAMYRQELVGQRHTNRNILFLS